MSRHPLIPWQVAGELRGSDLGALLQPIAGRSPNASCARLTTQPMAQDGLTLDRQSYDKLK